MQAPCLPAVAGINVNFCRNPACANFGVPADIVKWRRKAHPDLAGKPGIAYKLIAGGKKPPGACVPALRRVLLGQDLRDHGPYLAASGQEYAP